MTGLGRILFSPDSGAGALGDDALFAPLAGDAPAVTDAEVDAFFDRELDPAQAHTLLKRLRGDAARSEDVARTQRMVSLLRQPIDTPDFVDAVVADMILRRVESRRRFLPAAWRRAVTGGRLAAAALLLCGVLGVAVIERASPGALSLTARETPVSTLVQSTRAEAAVGVEQIATTIGFISTAVGGPETQRPAHEGAAGAGSLRAATGRVYQVLEPGRLSVVRPVGAGDVESAGYVVRGSTASAQGLLGQAVPAELLSTMGRRSACATPMYVPTRDCAPEGAAAPRPLVRARAVTVGPVAYQHVPVGDHLVAVPASMRDQYWGGGQRLVSRILLVPQSPQTNFPDR